jgi:hypothetical protein
MKFLLQILLALALLCGSFVNARQNDPRNLILEARNLADLHGNKIWQGFTVAPFGILLVEEETERLYCHEGPSNGFQMAGIDPVVSCPTGVRPASFSPNMLASFPAVDGIPTIVTGTPEATGKTSDEWVLTILHEHFHQLQFSRPGYYSGIADLNLSGGDETGMWMLNYPFPYERNVTVSAFQLMAETLQQALDARETEGFPVTLDTYWHSREAARRTVSDDDWRYIELQFWQEGVARWTESAVAMMSENYRAAARDAEARIIRELSTFDLAKQKRAAVYPIGAGEALLLESVDIDWRTSYWSEPFSLGSQIRKIVGQPNASPSTAPQPIPDTGDFQ